MTLLTVTPDGIEMKPFTIPTEKAKKLSELIFTLDQIDNKLKEEGRDSSEMSGIITDTGEHFKFNNLIFTLKDIVDNKNGTTTLDLDINGFSGINSDVFLDSFMNTFLGENLKLSIGTKTDSFVYLEQNQLKDIMDEGIFNYVWKIGTGTTVSEVFESKKDADERWDRIDLVLYSVAASWANGSHRDAEIINSITGKTTGKLNPATNSLKFEQTPTTYTPVDTVSIYRAVGYEEYHDIMKDKQFRFAKNTLEVKEFGNYSDETLKFANHAINKDKVAIIKVTLPQETYLKLEHLKLDNFWFKGGTPVVNADMLGEFNKNIININHAF